MALDDGRVAANDKLVVHLHFVVLPHHCGGETWGELSAVTLLMRSVIRRNKSAESTNSLYIKARGKE